MTLDGRITDAMTVVAVERSALRYGPRPGSRSRCDRRTTSMSRLPGPDGGGGNPLECLRATAVPSTGSHGSRVGPGARASARPSPSTRSEDGSRGDDSSMPQRPDRDLHTRPRSSPFAGHPTVGTAWRRSTTSAHAGLDPARALRATSREPGPTSQLTWIRARASVGPPDRRSASTRPRPRSTPCPARNWASRVIDAWAWEDEAAGRLRSRYFADRRRDPRGRGDRGRRGGHAATRLGPAADDPSGRGFGAARRARTRRPARSMSAGVSPTSRRVPSMADAAERRDWDAIVVGLGAIGSAAAYWLSRSLGDARPGARALRDRSRQRRVGGPQPDHPAVLSPARLRPPREARLRDMGGGGGRVGRADRDDDRRPRPVAGGPRHPEGRLHRQPRRRGRPVRAPRCRRDRAAGRSGTSTTT